MFQSLLAEGHSEEEAVDEASIVASQLAFARAVTGKTAEACERLKQIVRSRPSDSTVSLVSTANLAALGGYKDPHEALKRYSIVFCTTVLVEGKAQKMYSAEIGMI